MGNKRGKRRGRLANMGVIPEQRTYKPPKVPPAEEIKYSIEIQPPTDRFQIRMRTYKGKIVDFSITQVTKFYPQAPNWVQVARIDCCHGKIHRHQFNRAGVDLLDHQLITEIPEEGWDVVNAGYEDAYSKMKTGWKENLRRWRNG